MSTSDVANALRVPGRLAVGDSSFDFSASFPHGGLALGVVEAIALRHQETEGKVRIEDFGVAIEFADAVELGERFTLGFALRSWDPTALPAILRNVTTGAVTGQPVIQWPGARKEGALRSVNRAVELLFSPFDPEHPAVYFPRALPMLAQEREFLLGRSKDARLLATFVATRRGAGVGDGAQVGALEDLVVFS